MICFYLKRARPWLEFGIKFNRYSMRFFQRALVGLNNLWIHFIFIEFNWVFMPKVLSSTLQMASWARCLRGSVFFCLRRNWIFFQYPFWYILESYTFDLCTTVLIRGFGLQLSFYLSKGVPLCSGYGFFLIIYFVLIGVIEDKVTKIKPKYLTENCDHSICCGWSILFYMLQPIRRGFWKVYSQAKCIFIEF